MGPFSRDYGKCYKAHYNELTCKRACVFSPPHVGYRLNTWFMSECCFFDAEGSINAQVFAILKEEELGISFGGRKILKKLSFVLSLTFVKSCVTNL